MSRPGEKYRPVGTNQVVVYGLYYLVKMSGCMVEWFNSLVSYFFLQWGSINSTATTGGKVSYYDCVVSPW